MPLLRWIILAVLLAVSPAFAQEARFVVDGTVLSFDTETSDDDAGIRSEDFTELVKLLRANPEVTTVRLNSKGGSYYPALRMARTIVDFELNTEVADICSSSCAYIFLGGKERRLVRGGRLGFHRFSWQSDSIAEFYDENAEESGWDSPFDFAAWSYEDTQNEVYERLNFMLERGVDAKFAIETMRPANENMWYPYRIRLLAAGVLTQ